MGNSKKKSETLDSTMSLGDHLEELRMRLIYAIVGLVVCSIIGFCFGSKIITFLEKPYAKAMASMAPAQEKLTGAEPDSMSLQTPSLQTLAPADGIVTFVKIALMTGLIISSPWVFYHLWMFIAAGLYPHEKRYVHLAAPFSAVLFICGAFFFILVVAPLTLSFLVKFNQKFLGVSSRFTFQNYISFVTHLMLVFGIAFQTPTAIFFLNRAGLVSLKSLSGSRKYVVLVIVIVAAMVTPPDVVSQVT